MVCLTGYRRQSRRFIARAEAAMSTPHLPAELLDHVVDHLHDTKDALRNCCLVSKSWIPRTRKHLFASILFALEEDLESWKETFPNPSTSPGHYTEILIVRCFQIVAVADAEPGGWIRAFSHVVHLELGEYDSWRVSLLPFRGFSPLVKSLHLDFDIPPLALGLILSFPLLEDLAINFQATEPADGKSSNGLPTAIQPPNPPVFTGSLKLVTMGTPSVIRQLLALPSGIHFRKFVVVLEHGDISLITALVERCSHTLESLDITYENPCASIRHQRSCLQLTFVSSRISCTRSLEGNETPRLDFSAQIPRRWVDRRSNPNHDTQTSRALEDLDTCSLFPAFGLGCHGQARNSCGVAES